MVDESFGIFSPKNFIEYIGQNRAKKVATVIVNASRIEQRPLPNILIDGSHGLGKTSLARVIYNELNIEPKVVDASTFNKEDYSLPDKVIIDEIHNLDPQVADSLNILIDKGRTSFIGCTTNPGSLSPAFRSRFRAIHLERYTFNEIKQIISMVLLRKGVNTNGTAINDIAKRSRLNPRVALNNLAFIFDYMTVQVSGLTPKIVKEAFMALGIDKDGLTERDYSYIRALPDDRPVGIQYISAALGIDAKTIEAEIEPFLLQSKYIDRMPRGRIKLREI